MKARRWHSQWLSLLSQLWHCFCPQFPYRALREPVSPSLGSTNEEHVTCDIAKIRRIASLALPCGVSLFWGDTSVTAQNHKKVWILARNRCLPHNNGRVRNAVGEDTWAFANGAVWCHNNHAICIGAKVRFLRENTVKPDKTSSAVRDKCVFEGHQCVVNACKIVFLWWKIFSIEQIITHKETSGSVKLRLFPFIIHNPT